MRKRKLTVKILQEEAAGFAEVESTYPEPSLYGVTDGKAIGTYLEHKFRAHLDANYTFAPCNSASGIDFPGLGVDMKVTAITQPQSSSPFKSARQKIFGLGYAVLVFVYDKKDDPKNATSVLNILHTVFVEEHRTGDFTMTRLIRQHLEAGCNAEDLIGLMHDKNLWLDDIEANSIAEELLKKPCEQGYLTISNALQWRLQYSRAITQAGTVEGVLRLR
jgi:hypothetical protein